MENILVGSFVTFVIITLGVIAMTLIGFYMGHERGYEKGRRDERIKQYKQMQEHKNTKPNFIDAD